MVIRKATTEDISAVEKIYLSIHTAEEQGKTTTCWIRGVYPTRAVAENACSQNTLFVMENKGDIVGAAIINQTQVEEYKFGKWSVDAKVDEIMVLHTLVISPFCSGKGYGKAFVSFYEEYAKINGCRHLRMDTNEKNTIARSLYKKLGYIEVGTVPCDFNGIKNVKMVLLEKVLKG